MDEVLSGGTDRYYPQTAGALAKQSEGRLARPATRMERANLAVEEAERRLADLRRAQEILKKNPELQELLDIIDRNHF